MCSAHRLEHLLNFDKKSRCLIVITGIRLSFLQNKVLIHYTFINPFCGNIELCHVIKCSTSYSANRSFLMPLVT